MRSRKTLLAWISGISGVIAALALTIGLFGGSIAESSGLGPADGILWPHTIIGIMFLVISVTTFAVRKK